MATFLPALRARRGGLELDAIRHLLDMEVTHVACWAADAVASQLMAQLDADPGTAVSVDLAGWVSSVCAELDGCRRFDDFGAAWLDGDVGGAALVPASWAHITGAADARALFALQPRALDVGLDGRRIGLGRGAV